jgi:hypothetical protein
VLARNFFCVLSLEKAMISKSTFAKTLAIVLIVLLSPVSALPADMPVPLRSKPVPSRAVSDPAADATCIEWNDGCRTCVRGQDGAPSCSNVGIACVQRTDRCTKRR